VFGYDSWPNEGNVKFLAKFRAISPFPKIGGGARRRIQSQDIKITPYYKLLITNKKHKTYNHTLFGISVRTCPL